jgi:hypothetical protein
MVKELYTSYKEDSDDDSDKEMMAAGSTSPLDQARDEQCHS